VSERRTHVKRATRLTLEKYIVTPQMDLGRFACGSQLLQVTPTGFSLFIFLTTNGLRVCNPFWDDDGFSC
jgi:hypothetical protein